VALAAGLAGVGVAAALAGAFLAFTAAFGPALPFAETEAGEAEAAAGGADLPDAFAFAADAFALDLVTAGRAGVVALPLGLPDALLGMSFPIRKYERWGWMGVICAESRA
jgi:hypothetical protein